MRRRGRLILEPGTPLSPGGPGRGGACCLGGTWGGERGLGLDRASLVWEWLSWHAQVASWPDRSTSGLHFPSSAQAGRIRPGEVDWFLISQLSWGGEGQFRMLASRDERLAL